jgi:hypothetical protein
MGEETTQLDLTNELDRLEAMREEGTADDGEDALRLAVHDAVLDPDGVEGRRLTGMTVEGPSDLRGRRWAQPLDALHRSHVTARRGETVLDVAELVDAVGGPALDAPYVLDRETYAVGTVETVTETAVTLELIEAPGPDAAEGDGVELSRSAVTTATVAGYADRPRYRVFDPYGRPTDLPEA